MDDARAGIAELRETPQQQAEAGEATLALDREARRNVQRDLSLLLARRSEVAGLRLCYLRAGDGANTLPALFLARSKTDQEGRGHLCPIAPANVAAIESWIDGARLETVDPTTPLFLPLTKGGGIGARRGLSHVALTEMVQRHISCLDPARIGSDTTTAHAIRRGVARAIWEADVPDPEFMALGRRVGVPEMRSYVGLPALLTGAAARLGLS